MTWVTYPSLDLEEGRITWIVGMQLMCPLMAQEEQTLILIQRTEDEDGGS